MFNCYSESLHWSLSPQTLKHPVLQCKVAKMTCEKRIHDVTKIQKRKPHYADMRFKDSETKLLELDEILYSPYVLPFFVQVPFLCFSHEFDFLAIDLTFWQLIWLFDNLLI